MTSIADDQDSGPEPWPLRVKEAFWPPAPPRSSSVDEPEIIPAAERKAVMRSLDGREARFSFVAWVLAIVAGIAIPAYIVASNRVTKAGKNSISVAPDAEWLAAVILVLCVLGFVLLWKRKRTPMVFDLFFTGFAFTLFTPVLGFAFIIFGGWLMLRAWRINRYGTTIAKVIAKESANRPRGKDAKSTARATSSKTVAQPGARKAPSASKRYTPKAPPRKKIPKPTAQ
jgi:hypothetical protein